MSEKLKAKDQSLNSLFEGVWKGEIDSLTIKGSTNTITANPTSKLFQDYTVNPSIYTTGTKSMGNSLTFNSQQPAPKVTYLYNYKLSVIDLRKKSLRSGGDRVVFVVTDWMELLQDKNLRESVLLKHSGELSVIQDVEKMVVRVDSIGSYPLEVEE